jgi:hypothetical protein
LSTGQLLSRVVSAKPPAIFKKPAAPKLDNAADLQLQYNEINQLFGEVEEKFSKNTNLTWLKRHKEYFDDQSVNIAKIKEMTDIGTEELEHISKNLNGIKMALTALNQNPNNETVLAVAHALETNISNYKRNLNMLAECSKKPKVTPEVSNSSSPAPHHSGTTQRREVQISRLNQPSSSPAPRTPPRKKETNQTGSQKKEDGERSKTEKSVSSRGATYQRVLGSPEAVGVPATPRFRQGESSLSPRVTAKQTSKGASQGEPQVDKR